MPSFIDPNCREGSIDHDRKEGLLDQPVACQRCGFGFLFELMEDYYPAPGAGMVVCDQDGRVLACGRGLFELTGYPEEAILGADVVQALGLSGFDAERNPAKLALEWGVPRLGAGPEPPTRSGAPKHVRGDFFPAYDEDGGLLVALSPR